MTYRLRYQVLKDDSWVYHLGDDAGAACGARPTEPLETEGDGDHTEAFLLLLGHDLGDAQWCHSCLHRLTTGWAARLTRVVGEIGRGRRRSSDTRGIHVDEDTPHPAETARALSDLAAALDPDPRGDEE